MQVINGTASPQNGVHATKNSACFVCGQDNPSGLRICFQQEESGEIRAAWTPDPTREGFRGIVHGGLVSTVLDEAMSKAVAATEREALTAELRVRFRQPVKSGETFEIRGWVVRQKKRLIETEAALVGGDGQERAHAWARFLVV